MFILKQSNQIKHYKMTEITQKLGLKRPDLVAMALLLGCDYDPEGAHGVGKAKVIKFIESMKGKSLMKRYVIFGSYFHYYC